MPSIRISCAALLTGLAVAGCAGGEPSDEAQTRMETPAAETPSEATDVPVRTAKTGPAIEVDFALRSPVNPGETGVVTVTVHDGYDAGTLNVAAASKTGLGVFPASGSTRFSMAGDTAHVWDIYFKTDIGGAHYLDIYVTAADESGATIGARAFSFAVAVGNAAAAASKTQGSPVVTDADGEKKVIMEADETIVTEPQ